MNEIQEVKAVQKIKAALVDEFRLFPSHATKFSLQRWLEEYNYDVGRFFCASELQYIICPLSPRRSISHVDLLGKGFKNIGFRALAMTKI